jgi:hypothetical protein
MGDAASARTETADVTDVTRRIADVELEVRAVREDISRLLVAFDALDGGPTTAEDRPDGRRAAGLVGPPRPVLDDDELRAAVEGESEGLAPRDIRAALRVPAEVSPTRLSRALADAVERGIVRRVGNGRASRYVARLP